MFRSIAISGECAWKDQIRILLANRGIHVTDISGNENPMLNAAGIAQAVSLGMIEGGIVLDDYGIAASILCNKYPAVRASHCGSQTTAMYTRCHNQSNLLCLPCELVGEAKGLNIVSAWLDHEFEGGRHAISVGMIRDGEQEQFTKQLWDMKLDNSTLPACSYPFHSLYIGCDHAGYEAKKLLIPRLEESGIQVTDIGTGSTNIVRYPYYAARCDHAVLAGECDGAILICGTGIGMSIACNKFKGIRGALCNDVTTAVAARKYTDANVLCLGGKIIGTFELNEVVSAFLDTPYDGGTEWISLIASLEKAQLRTTSWRPEHNV